MSVPKLDDLSALFASNESRLLKIEDPVTGKPLKGTGDEDMGIWVTDSNSPACEDVKAEMSRQVAKAQKKGRMLSYEKQKAFGEDLLVAAITGFQALIMDGKPLEYSEKNARKLLRSSPVIRKLVDDVVGSDELFTKGASAKSGGE